MTNLTLSEFQGFLASKKPACYVYSTANQSSIHSTLSVMSRYANARVSLGTMRIMLYGDQGYMCFNRVRRVETSDEESDGCPIRVDIICAEQNGKEVKHTVLATNRS